MLKLTKLLKSRIDRALGYLSQFEVNRTDCIVVGSSIVSLVSERVPGDIDIALRPEVYSRLRKNQSLREKVISESGTIDIDPDFQVLLNRYGDIRLKDSQLFSNNALTFELEDIIFVRPEIEMAKKISRNYDKDLKDIDFFLNYIQNTSEWDWSYIQLSKPFNRKELIIRGCNRLLRNPYVAVRKIQDRLVHKLGNGFNRNVDVAELPMKVIDLGTLLQLQTKNGTLQRYDIIVRKLFADAYLRAKHQPGSSDSDKLPVELYETMQRARIGRETTTRFSNLLENLIMNGHDQGRFPIYLNNKGHIYDGSHRVASAISLKNHNLPIRINKFLFNEPLYGKSWFLDKFTTSQIELLEITEKEILLSTGAAFKLILWPPALAFIEEVLAMIKKYHKIISIEREVEINDMRQFVDDIYKKDGIAKWKIERKKSYFDGYEPEITVISIVVERPGYKRNQSTGSYLSARMASLKGSIRQRISSQITDYFGDVVCHSSDNPQMSREIDVMIKTYRANVRKN